MNTPSINAFGNVPRPPSGQPARASGTEYARSGPDGGAGSASDAPVQAARDEVSVSEAAAVASAARGEEQAQAPPSDSGTVEQIREAIKEVQSRATSVRFQIDT